MKRYEYASVVLGILLACGSVFSYGSTGAYATSTSATTTFNISGVVPGAPDDEGGGGTPVVLPTEVSFTGYAYPGAVVTLLKNGQIERTVTVGTNSLFSILLNTISAGTYTFSLSAKDVYQTTSDSLSYTVYVAPELRTELSGIVFSPTVNMSDTEVEVGEQVIIFGQAMQNSSVLFDISGVGTSSVTSTSGGLYQYVLDTTGYSAGQYTIRTKVKNASGESAYTSGHVLTVGSTTPEVIPFLIADVNYDDKVDIVDFSLAAYWYKRTLSAAFLETEAERLNGDGIVDLRDFSLMAYHWTG